MSPLPKEGCIITKDFFSPLDEGCLSPLPDFSRHGRRVPIRKGTRSTMNSVGKIVLLESSISLVKKPFPLAFSSGKASPYARVVADLHGVPSPLRRIETRAQGQNRFQISAHAFSTPTMALPFL